MAKTATKVRIPIPNAKLTLMANAILDEMKTSVKKGLGRKVFGKGVEDALKTIMRPKIKRRLTAGGIWAKEKSNPLKVARHMGQIAALLSRTNTVDISVASAALDAVKSDEHCRRGAIGGGDWCF
jgi:hypothetical protein